LYGLEITSYDISQLQIDISIPIGLNKILFRILNFQNAASAHDGPVTGSQLD
jgi:hypothetical protein